MKTFSFSLIILLGFALTACKKDPPIPPFKFYDGVGTLSVGQSGLFYLKDTTEPIELKFVKVVSDSRCPEGAMCAFAGFISVEILLDKKVTKIIPELNNPSRYKGYQITVNQATPDPKSGSVIREEDYKIEFKIYK